MRMIQEPQTRILTPVQRMPFLALLSANGISEFGSNLTFVVIPWFVLQTTGNAAKTGLTLAIGSLPVIISGFFGGAIVDRLGYRRSSVVADLSSGLAVALIPLLYHTVGLAFWELLLLVFLRGLCTTPGYAARQSLLPDLATRAQLPLERANSLAQAISRLALLLGPPLAGILIAIFGASNVLWLDAASFAISAGLVAATAPLTGRDRTESAAGASSYLAETLDGFRFIKRNRVLAWLTFTFALGSLLSEPLYVVGLPVFAKEVYGSAFDLGLLYSALAAGSLGGLLLYGVVGTRFPRRTFLLTGFLTRALGFWVLVMLPSLPVALAVIVIEAVLFEPINPLWASFVQARVPEGMRGRVFATFAAISGGTLPAGTLIGGILIGATGLVITLAIIAAATLTQAIGMFFVPAFRKLDDPTPIIAGTSHH